MSLVLTQSGCRIGFYSQAFLGQAKVVLCKQDNESVIADPETPDEVRDKLKLVGAIKQFAYDQIGLVENDNYEYFYQLENEAISYTVVACPPDSLQTVTWTFPIIGELPYIGFFAKSEALEQAQELKAKGYDVAVWPAGAYSTLGWFTDPVLSSMIEYDDLQFVDILLHEQTHATVYTDTDISFNENLAVFVAYQGSLKFWQKRGRDDLVALAKARRHDQLLASKELKKLTDALSAMYASAIPKKEKLIQKRHLVAKFRRNFRKNIRPKLQSDWFGYLSSLEVNNAILATASIYGESLNEFEVILKKNGGDLRQCFAELSKIAESDDPTKQLNLMASEEQAKNKPSGTR